MRCPFCGNADSQVKDSRPSEDGAAIRRRRFCTECGGRFTTFERVQLRELTIVKRSGRRNPFDREKLVRSISIALRKDGTLATPVQISAPGCLDPQEDKELIDEIRAEIAALISKPAKGGSAKGKALDESIRNVLRKIVRDELGKKPVLDVHVHQV